MYFKPCLQVILNDVFNHKCHYRSHWHIPGQNVVIATRWCQLVQTSAFLKSANIPWCKAFLHASRLSWTFNGVLLVFFIRPRVSPLPPATFSDDLHLGEALAAWRNKYHWFKEWYRQKNTDFLSYLLFKLPSFFKIQYHFFGKMNRKLEI